MKVQINNVSSGKLKGMSALTMLAVDNLKNFWKIFLKLYQLFHVQTEHEMSQVHPSHDEKGRMYPFIPRRATFKTDSTILPQSWSSNVPALFWRSQHLIVSLWLQESLKEILSTVDHFHSKLFWGYRLLFKITRVHSPPTLNDSDKNSVSEQW